MLIFTLSFWDDEVRSLLYMYITKSVVHFHLGLQSKQNGLVVLLKLEQYSVGQ